MKKKTTRFFAAVASLLVMGALGFTTYSAPITTTEAAASNFVSKYRSEASDAIDALKRADALNQKLAEEGSVLIKNDNNTLPLKTGLKISVFGKNSVNPFYTGGGSASGADGGGLQGVKSYTFLDGLENAGFTLNPNLVSFYNNNGQSGNGRDGGSGTGQVATITGETPVSSYNNTLKATFAEYNDAAIVFLARAGGEGGDLRTNYTGNSTGRSNRATSGHPEQGDHYLELDDNEEAMIEMVKENFDKVIIILNMGTSFEMGDLKADDGIDAVLWVGYPGGSGFNSVGKLLNGEATPSGKLADTWAADFKADPTFANFASNYTYTTTGAGSIQSVSYEEGIYVGYRYYETRGYTENDNGAWYDANVVYPFGYGMSYTTFSKTAKFVTDALDPGGEVKAEVTVTNTGKYAGKEVVQMYASAPYTEGEVEKSHVVLGGFEKTKLLKPGESQTVTVSMKVRDMASYDYNDANANGTTGYELDAGEYTVYIGDNAHAWFGTNAYGKKTYTLGAGFRYATDAKSGTEIKNRFDIESNYFDPNATGPWAAHGTQMSRADFVGTFPQPPTQAERTITSEENQMATFTTTAAAINERDAGKPWYTDKMPTVENGKRNISATRLVGLDFNDRRWDSFMDQLTYNEMAGLVMHGFFQTDAIADLDVPMSITPDGPTGFVGGSSRKWVSGTCTYAAPIVVASTWNKELALEMGECVGDESIWGGDSNSTSSSAYAYPGGYNGWYAPGNNTHRSPFSGRNFEYYSEDPTLAGQICAQVVKGAQSKGVFVMMKHFALNDQETNRGNLATWATEQTMREIYLRSFEIAVKEGGATGMMSAFNRIGYEWAGFSYPLLTEILREEWGFNGVVITDWVNGFMNADYMVRAGNDLWLANGNVTSLNNSKTTATGVTAVRRAAKSVLYAAINSNAMNRLGNRYFKEHYQGNNFYVALGTKAKGDAVSYDAKSTNYTSYEYVLTGAPKGLTINATTGAISGTIAEDAVAGDYEMTVSLKDAGGYIGQAIRLRMTVGGGITFTGNNEAKLTLGQFNRANVASELKGKNVSYQIKGTLPEGMALTADGAIIGVPTTAGTSTFTVVAMASGAENLETAVTLTVAEPINVAYRGSTLTAGKAGEAYSANVATATGAEGITYASSDMPAGLTIAANGAISGTPTAEGTYTFHVTASATDAEPVTAEFTVTIAKADEPAGPTSAPTSTTNSTENESTSSSKKKSGGMGCGGVVGIGGIGAIVASVCAAAFVTAKKKSRKE